MKTFIKTLLQGVAVFAIGVSIHTFNSAQANYMPSDDNRDVSYDSDSSGNENEASKNDNNDNGDLAGSEDGTSQNDTNDDDGDLAGNNDEASQGVNNDSGPSGSEDENSSETEEQQSEDPTLQVRVKMNMSGKYKQMFAKEKGKFQIFLRALSDLNNSKKGSKPVRLDLNGDKAIFDDKAGDQPQGVLVAISKAGTNYQHFCSGKNMKDGVIKSFPKGISITLKDANSPYATKAGVLRNDSYPNCEVEVQN